MGLQQDIHWNYLKISSMGFTFCKLRNNVVDIMFTYDLLNGLIDSLELLYMIGFDITNNIRKPNLFYILFHKHKYY